MKLSRRFAYRCASRHRLARWGYDRPTKPEFHFCALHCAWLRCVSGTEGAYANGLAHVTGASGTGQESIGDAQATRTKRAIQRVGLASLIVLGVFDLLGSSDEVLNCLKSAFVTDQGDKKFPRHSKKSVQNRDIFLWRFTVMHPF